MNNTIIRTPLLSVNAKSYLWGEDLLKIAQHCEKRAIENGISISMNLPYVDLYRISQCCPHLILNAQGVDADEPGGKMGAVLPEMLKASGADGVILNHASSPMSLNNIIKTVERCKRLGLFTFICADRLEECRLLAELHPTGMVVEQAALIGTGILADESYIQQTTRLIRSIDSEILIMHGAGIKSGEDIYRNIRNGSETGGGASGIFCSQDPIATIDDYVQGILRAKRDFGSRIIAR